MAALTPFRALHPTPAAAARVAAPPYDVVTTAEARALAAHDPLSFLHVSRAEIDLPDGTHPYADEVYARALANLETLRARAPLMVDAAPALYLYRLRMGGHTQTGVAGCFSVAEYEQDVIRKHERTRKDKEDDRTRHILALRAQTGPVFLTYRAVPAVRAVSGRVLDQELPLFDFVAPDGVGHTVWRLREADSAALVTAFATIPALYIADGHHRAASAARARQRLAVGGASGPWDWFLAVAFPDEDLRVLPYNRLVSDLGAHTPGSLLDAMRRLYTIHAGPASPARRGEVAMFLDGQWQTIVLGDAPAALPPDRRLDVSRLQETILEPLLGIGDVRTDTRIDFAGGIRGTAELEQRVRSGAAAVAFSMYPVSVDDIMQISDAGGIMPPKSTWFEPKLRDGLVVHLI